VQIFATPAMINPGLYPMPMPFGGMDRPINENGFSDHPLPEGRRDPVVGGAWGIAGYLPERLRWDLQAECVHDG
jgi:hypothetical protein